VWALVLAPQHNLDQELALALKAAPVRALFAAQVARHKVCNNKITNIVGNVFPYMKS